MVNRFGWLGASRRANLISRLVEELDAWWSQWALMASTPWMEIAESSPVEAYDLAGAPAHVALAVDGQVAEALTGFDADTDDLLRSHVSARATLDLLNRLSGSAERVGHRKAAADLPAHFREARLGASRIVLSNGALTVNVRLTRTAADVWSPAPAHKPRLLADRHTTLDSATVRIQADLDLGLIPLKELRGLSPGDVIATSTLLGALFNVREAAKGRLISQARLGRKKGHRALEMEANHGE